MYLRLQSVVDHPHSSIDDIAAVVQSDPGLTTRLLRVVNSAMFEVPQRVETVNRAVTLVGALQLRALALATSVIRSFREVPGDLVNIRSFWQHSIAVGLAAREIAVLHRRGNEDRMFIAGMLHDVGSLVLYQRMPDVCRELLARAKREGRALAELELEVLGFDHAAVGGALLAQWNLSQAHQEAVRFHHAPEAAQTFTLDAATVHVADLVAEALAIGASGEPAVPRPSIRALDLLELGARDADDLVDRVHGSYGEVAAAFLGASA